MLNWTHFLTGTRLTLKFHNTNIRYCDIFFVRVNGTLVGDEQCFYYFKILLYYTEIHLSTPYLGIVFMVFCSLTIQCNTALHIFTWTLYFSSPRVPYALSNSKQCPVPTNEYQVNHFERNHAILWNDEEVSSSLQIKSCAACFTNLESESQNWWHMKCTTE
jgi:hypothetical protein